MKNYLFFLFFSLSFQCLFGQNFGYTKTKITLKNEFGIPYQNAKIMEKLKILLDLCVFFQLL